MEQSPIMPTAVRYGLILGGALVVYSLILFVTGLHMNQGLSYVSYVLIIGGLVMAMLDYRRGNQGFMSFGQGFRLGLLTSVVSSILSSIFSALYVGVINPGIKEEMLAKTREEMAKNPQMTEEAMDMAMKMSEKMFTPWALAGIGLVGGIIMGIIFSLIISAILKKDGTPGGSGLEEIGG